uniref:MKRN2 opposite strand protein n=1 Tax=Strigamia maritima TaxID=126957 RepID=T1JLW0_STRMM
MAEDEGAILCFQHCESKKRIFCFKFPAICPICGCDLLSLTTNLIMPPFRVPYPFSDASKMSCCVVIKPTTGNFLFTYHNSCNLHIGVTDSQGVVYEYKKEGIVHTDTHTWAQCIAVDIISKYDPEWKRIWDLHLRKLSSQLIWSSLEYNEETHNCYSFVLTFLRLLQLPYLFQYLSDRTFFCQKFILPRTLTAAKYITLFRKILNERINKSPKPTKIKYLSPLSIKESKISSKSRHFFSMPASITKFSPPSTGWSMKTSPWQYSSSLERISHSYPDDTHCNNSFTMRLTILTLVVTTFFFFQVIIISGQEKELASGK